MLANKTLELINETLEKNQDIEFRKHLGASQIGYPCARKTWFDYHWAKIDYKKAATLRLLKRGTDEENRFIKIFKSIGVQVWFEDKNKKQYKVSAHNGHFGGSMDGIGRGIPDLPAQLFVFEFKTHNEASFNSLKKDRVFKSKIQHFAQCQIYMFLSEIKWTLYCAVNKNTDEIYLELIQLDEKAAKECLEKADQIIYNNEPPLRISNKITWYMCVYCLYKNICHKKELPLINCRTCAHGFPSKDESKPGLWLCEKNGNLANGVCGNHVYNPFMLNGIEIVADNFEENWLQLKIDSKDVILHGPDKIPSIELSQYYK